MDFDSDGISLHYEVHGPESGAPIVLVHGFASYYRLNWVGTRWQETLTGAGFRVIGIQCVLDFPSRLRRTVLGGGGIKGALAQAQSIARALRGGVPENPIAKSFSEFARARPHNDLEALAVCIEALSPPFDLGLLKAVKTPILLVVGGNDELVSGAEDLVELMPTAKLVIVPGRDHLGTVPAREFKEAALAFLEAD